jgi:hypothetical protein
MMLPGSPFDHDEAVSSIGSLVIVLIVFAAARCVQTLLEASR